MGNQQYYPQIYYKFGQPFYYDEYGVAHCWWCPIPAQSPTKKRMQSAGVTKKTTVDESVLVESQIELAHETSTANLVNQYKRVMDDL